MGTGDRTQVVRLNGKPHTRVIPTALQLALLLQHQRIVSVLSFQALLFTTIKYMLLKHSASVAVSPITKVCPGMACSSVVEHLSNKNVAPGPNPITATTNRNSCLAPYTHFAPRQPFYFCFISVFCLFVVCCLRKGLSHSIEHIGLRLTAILLSQLPEGWG